MGLLAGCGGGNTGAPEGETQVNDGVNDGGAANEEEGDAEGPAQPQPAELENFTSGILYEEGEYLFEIDSMEMTEDAYVITYHAATDAQNYSTYYDMELTVNGVAAFMPAVLAADCTVLELAAPGRPGFGVSTHSGPSSPSTAYASTIVSDSASSSSPSLHQMMTPSTAES